MRKIPIIDIDFDQFKKQWKKKSITYKHNSSLLERIYGIVFESVKKNQEMISRTDNLYKVENIPLTVFELRFPEITRRNAFKNLIEESDDNKAFLVQQYKVRRGDPGDIRRQLDLKLLHRYVLVWGLGPAENILLYEVK